MLITGVLVVLTLQNIVECSIDSSEVLDFANKIKKELPFDVKSEHLSEKFYAEVDTNPNASFRYTGDVYQSYVNEFKSRYRARLDLQEFNNTRSIDEILEIHETRAVFRISIFFDQILNNDLTELWMFTISCTKSNDKLIVEKLEISPFEFDMDQRKQYSMNAFLKHNSKWMTSLNDHKAEYEKGENTWSGTSCEVTITPNENMEVAFQKAKNRSFYNVNATHWSKNRKITCDGKTLNVVYAYVYKENGTYRVIRLNVKAEYNYTFDRFDFIHMHFHCPKKPTAKEISGNSSLSKILNRQNPL